MKTTLESCKVGDTVNLLKRDGTICTGYTYKVICTSGYKLLIESDAGLWFMVSEDGSAWNIGGLVLGKFVRYEETFKIGEKININGATYIVACVNRGTVCLINIKSGERWCDPRECDNTYKVTTKELGIAYGIEWSRAN